MGKLAELDVVITDDRQLFWHGNVILLGPVHGPEGIHVASKNCGEAKFALVQAFHGVVTGRHAEADGLANLVFIERQSVHTVRVPKALDHERFVFDSAERSNLGVAQGDQVRGSVLRGLKFVYAYGIETAVSHADEHHDGKIARSQFA